MSRVARAVRRGTLPGALASFLLVASASGCVSTAAPASAELRTTPPPWDAPRDGISYIRAAGLPELPFSDNANPRTFTLTITRNGTPVTVAANIGLDRVRAIQSPVHTHDESGLVWLEGRGNDAVTLGQLFTVWGVRFDAHCLGDVCGTVTVTVDGTRATGDPTAVRLFPVRRTVAVAVAGG